ncbi:hypothetical protein GCM10009730_33820 [Streptomyces albidochromogenes]|uniref:hypothetical protein n=1 Tax=Streptomyces albidochromogenes TaxID=329524 RepID=UPI00110FB709|nr:hypothetical protein [Streptomyces albidochromogenes]
MEAFGDDSAPVHGVSWPGAYWLDVPPRAEGDCVWCAQLWHDGGPDPRGGGADERAASGDGRAADAVVPSMVSALAVQVRLVMLSVAACAVVSAMLAVVLA